MGRTLWAGEMVQMEPIGGKIPPVSENWWLVARLHGVQQLSGMYTLRDSNLLVLGPHTNTHPKKWIYFYRNASKAHFKATCKLNSKQWLRARANVHIFRQRSEGISAIKGNYCFSWEEVASELQCTVSSTLARQFIIKSNANSICVNARPNWFN